jgi:hypothetical protein
MADQVMTKAANLSVIVPQIWSRRYYDVLLADLPFNSIVSRDWEGEITALGDRVKISSFPEFSDATELAEDAANDADAITVTQQDLIINKRIVKDFIVTSLAQLQSLPAMDKLREMAVYAILKKIQKIIIDDIAPSVAAPDHTLSYTGAGGTLAFADLLASKKLLDAADVPMPDRHCVLGASATNSIFNITGFTSSDFVTGNSLITTGQLQNALLGFVPHFTTEVGNVSFLFHRSFYTMAAQQGLSIKEFDLGVQGKRGVRINIDTLAGFKQLDNVRVVSIS